MKKWPMLVVLLALLPAVAPLQIARADGEAVTQDEVERARKTMEDDKRRLKEEAEQQKKDGAIARKRLNEEFKIDASKMSDSEAIIRLRDEVNDREAASEAAAQQQREDAQAQQEKQQQELLKKQDALMKGAFGKGSEEISNDEDAGKEMMYERMVGAGVAPQCRGKNGAALITCVDAAMGAE